MVPPQLVTKMARECFLTLPRVRVFLIDGVRNGVGSNGFAGVNEVRLRNGRIVREGLQTTLSDLRLRKQHRSARARWNSTCDCPAVFIVGRDRAKLSYHWRHAFGTPRSGPFNGAVVNPDTGRPVLTADDQLRRADFRKVKHHEFVLPDEQSGAVKARQPSARSGRPMERRFAGVRPSISSADTSPRHSAPPRYVSEKLVRDASDSALTGTSDGRSLRRPPPSSSPGSEPSVSDSSIRAPLPERTPLRAATHLGILLEHLVVSPPEQLSHPLVRHTSRRSGASRMWNGGRRCEVCTFLSAKAACHTVFRVLLCPLGFSSLGNNHGFFPARAHDPETP
jgi:hypothetical protein